MRLTPAIVVALFAIPALAADAVPAVLSHYGRLLDSSDQPVTGTVSMTIALLDNDNPNKTDTLWREDKQVVVTGGYFRVVLGDGANGGTPFPADVLQKPELFLSIKIGGTELQPRQRVASTIYALRAGHAAMADAVAKGAITADMIANGAITLNKLALGSGGKIENLDADTLDGLDSAAFAPAAIEAKVDAIKTSVGTGLATAVGGLDTKLGTPASGSIASDIASIKSTVDSSVSTGLSGISAKLGEPPSGSTLSLQVAGVKTDVAGVKSDIAAVNTAIGNLSTTLGGTNSGLASDVAALKIAVNALSYGVVQSVPGLSCADIQKKNGGHGPAFYWVDADGPSGSNPAAQQYCATGPDGSMYPAARSCKDVKAANASASDGFYTLSLASGATYQAFCDMTTDGGGWTFVTRIVGASGWAHDDCNAVGPTPNPSLSTSAKLADSVINGIGGTVFRLNCKGGITYWDATSKQFNACAQGGSIRRGKAALADGFADQPGDDTGRGITANSGLGGNVYYGYSPANGGTPGCHSNGWGGDGTLMIR